MANIRVVRPRGKRKVLTPNKRLSLCLPIPPSGKGSNRSESQAGPLGGRDLGLDDGQVAFPIPHRFGKPDPNGTTVVGLLSVAGCGGD
jgi:hypothetical protein